MHRSVHIRPGLVHVPRTAGKGASCHIRRGQYLRCLRRGAGLCPVRGRPYALLYLSTTGGRPDEARCLRLVQRGPGWFTASPPTPIWRSGKMDSSTFASLSLAKKLAAPAGHFTTLCPGFTSEVYYEMLWVKQGLTTGFSLIGELADLQRPLPPGQALEPLAWG